MLIDIDRLSEKGLKICRDFDFLSSELIEESGVFFKTGAYRCFDQENRRRDFNKGENYNLSQFYLQPVLDSFRVSY